MADKKGLLIALGIGKPKSKMTEKEPDAEDPKESSEGGDDFEAAADSMFDALKDDDREGFRMALKTAVMACQDYDNE